MFEEVLRPRFNFRNSDQRRLQVEIHVFISPTEIKASILLNRLRLVGILDLILELKCFVFDKIEEDIEEGVCVCMYVCACVPEAFSTMVIKIFTPPLRRG